MALTKLNGLVFEPEKPILAPDYNRMVDASVRFTDVWPAAHHSDRGTHEPTTFEKALLVLQTPNGIDWLELVSAGIKGWGATPRSGGGSVISLEVAMPFDDPLSWGVIAYRKLFFQVPELLPGKTSTATKLAVSPATAGDILTAIIVGRPRP